MGTVIDTSALVRLERTGVYPPNLEAPEPTYVTAITVSELQIGVLRAATPRQQQAAAEFLESVLRHFPILPFGVSEALMRAELFEVLRRNGLVIGERDLQIAATAMVGGHAVLTGNVREFGRIPGLAVLSLPL